MSFSSRAVDRVWETDWEPQRDSSPLDSWSPADPGAPKGLTIANTVAKVSVVTDTAGGTKSLARDEQVLTIPQRTSTGALSADPEVFWVTALAEAEVLGHRHCFVEVAGQRVGGVCIASEGDRTAAFLAPPLWDPWP